MGQLIKVAKAQEVPPGTAKAVDVEGRAVALFNVNIWLGANPAAAGQNEVRH